MKQEEVNEIKSQLWDHLQYLNGRVKEVERTWYAVKRWNWLDDQYNFCKSEIAYWKNY